MNKTHIGILVGILCIAGYFRFVGINWDQNQHLHPDERFLTMVATSLTWPTSIQEYFDTATSPVNPHNKGFGFYVYGTWPVLLVKAIAERVGMSSYDGMTIIGRICSGITDLLILILVYKIAKIISNKVSAGLIAAALYACMIIPIQLAHFFTVDPYITLFITLSFLILILLIHCRKYSMQLMYSIVLGASFGLAVSAKVSAVFFIVVIVSAYMMILLKKQNIIHLIVSGAIFSLSFYITLRTSYPYLFTEIFIPHLNPLLLANWKELKAFNGINTGFPPALQWIPTMNSFFLPLHTFLWGLGIPIGLTLCIIVLFSIIKVIGKKRISNEVMLTLIWIVFLLSYQSIQFAKPLRYEYPAYPIIAVFFGIAGISLWNQIRIKKWAVGLFCALCFFIYWWAWGFTSIYRTPHSRTQSSYWIYENIPEGSRLTYEIWDDAVPVNFENYSSSLYHIEGLPLYDPDSPEKWKSITTILERSDYITITSNRLWRSLYALPKRFPNTSLYYKLLFSESLGFTNIATFTSYPCLIPTNNKPMGIPTNLRPPPFSITTTSNCLLALNDDGAEESFTVYDHPKVILFKKTTPYTKDQLFGFIYGQQ